MASAISASASAPVLADFEDQPGVEFKFALADQIAGAEQQAGPLFERRLPPDDPNAFKAAVIAGSPLLAF